MTRQEGSWHGNGRVVGEGREDPHSSQGEGGAGEERLLLDIQSRGYCGFENVDICILSRFQLQI